VHITEYIIDFFSWFWTEIIVYLWYCSSRWT